MNKIKKKKALIAIAAVFLVAVIGGTLAYFNSSAIFENLFNLGNYNIVTQEVFTSPPDWSPGDTTYKTLKARNNGTINAAVRVKYEEEWTDSNGDEISNIPNDAVILNFTTPSKWTYNSTDGYYYYNYYLKSGEETTSLIDSVTLNSNLNNTSCVEENGMQTCTSNAQGLAGATYTLTFTIETAEYDKYQQIWNTDQSITERKLYILPSNRTESNLQVGDEICVDGATTECFNFIGYDGNNIKMLAEYNLKVGEIYGEYDTKLGEYTSNDIGYGLQSSEVKGKISGENSKGTVAFSDTNYWYDGEDLKSKYGSTYPADVYDTDYSDATGANYSIAYYVENYKDTLESYGLTIQDARLLKYSEATSASIGCDNPRYNCPTNSFITNTSFWLESASGKGYLYDIVTTGRFYDSSWSNKFSLGVRPVIEVTKNEVNSKYKNRSPITLPANRTKDTLQVGDEICIEGTTTECFNFIRYDGNDIVMLSKWNLNVGDNPNGTETFLQDSATSGVNNYGTVAFSERYYWIDSNYYVKEKYGEWPYTDIYDTDYVTAPDFNNDGYNTEGYSIAYYVEEYKNILESYGAQIKNTRLLTYREATDSSIGCDDVDNNSCTANFITNTTFWLSGSYDYDAVRIIEKDYNRMSIEIWNNSNIAGVRPVVVVSKSDI